MRRTCAGFAKGCEAVSRYQRFAGGFRIGQRGIARNIPYRSGEWVVVVTPYVVTEVIRNLPDFPLIASAEWVRLRSQLLVMDDVLTLDRPVIFPASKDRPILFGALAWADVLLTLDRRDFASLLDGSFYGLPVLKPGTFIARERAAGRLRKGER